MKGARIRVSRNATRYSGRELRTLLCLVHRSVAQRTGRRIPPHAWVAISVVYARGETGARWTNGTTLALPKVSVTRQELVQAAERWVAWKMGRGTAYSAGCTPAQHGSLYEAPEPAPLPPEAARYERLLAKEQRWVRKLDSLERQVKRATTELAKITRAKRYYNRTLLAPVERRTDGDDEEEGGGADQHE